MKKFAKRSLALCLSLMLVLGCALTVSASDTAAESLTDLVVEDGYTLVPLDANGAEITASEGVYSNVEKLQLSFTGAAGEQYVAFLLYEETVPTGDNIRYINQIPGTGSELTFVIYPDQMAKGGTYYVYVSSSNAYTQVGSFTVVGPAYTLGDVNEDGNITSTDASYVLQYIVGMELGEAAQAAADTNQDGVITSTDASYILQYIVGNELF